MGKDTRLVNIYIKIHNKRTLTVEDLKYLSKYDPECFEKTCRNIVYKLPKTKEILQPKAKEEKQPPKPPIFEKIPTDKQRIEEVLANLRQMELKELPVDDVRADEVKELLGNLYMELLFPHNDRERFFRMEDHEELSTFNKKV